jgi:hypothetical protein
VQRTKRHWTPSGGGGAPIEIWFSILARKLLRRGNVTSKQHLKASRSSLKVPLIWIEGRMAIKNPASRVGFAIGIGAAGLGF